MLYRFKSRASGDVIMLAPHAEALLRLIGKEPAEKGVLMPEHMPAALAALRHAVQAEKAGESFDLDETQPAAATRGGGAGQAADESPGQAAADDPVTLAQRAWPFMQMIERSLAEGQPIMWGV